LADIFLPRDEYYLPFPSDEPVDTIVGSCAQAPDHSSSDTAILNSSGFSTPLPTEFEKAHIFTGAWSPGFRTPIINLDQESDQESVINSSSSASTTASTTASISVSASSSNELSTSMSSTHWILHPKLLGIAIRVDVDGGPFDTVQTKKKNGIFVKTVSESDRVVPMVVDLLGRQNFVSVERIHKFCQRPKPSSERSLMVVIEGAHTGKYVRQIYHFFQGGKVEENNKFIVMVVDRSGNIERLSEELLELDRDEVELVQETADERRYMNNILKDTRDSWRTGQPEIRS
jgi:hypothetical protein